MPESDAPPACRGNEGDFALTETRLILHIGGAKCGSSALQTALSHADWDAEESGLVYAALHTHHGLMHGKKLKLHAMQSRHGYATSSMAQELLEMPPEWRSEMIDKLRALAAGPRRVVLSNEGWLQQADLFLNHGLLDELGLPFDIFLVVRPQVEFMNSGWWQWAAWTKGRLIDWVHQKIREVQWYGHLEKWRGHPNFREAKVRLLSKDIVGDFLTAFNAPPPPGIENLQTNTSLPGDILRLYQRHPHLRPGPDVSGLDFVMSRLGIGGAPTPWVIPPALADEVVTASRADNERLLAILPEEEAARMRANPAWWSAEAFAGKTLQSPLPQEPDAAAIDDLCASLVDAVARYDQELRLLRSKAAAATKPTPGRR